MRRKQEKTESEHDESQELTAPFIRLLGVDKYHVHLGKSSLDHASSKKLKCKGSSEGGTVEQKDRLPVAGIG